jgi:undecaprenyl-diphosphatase
MTFSPGAPSRAPRCNAGAGGREGRLVSELSYLEAIVVGAFQGITELFPVSSLGHSILVPALAGGRWARDLDVSAPESPYLAFIVGLHVATAAALLVFFWRDWLRIVAGFVSSVRYRRVRTSGERLAWLLIVGTIPVGISGLLLEHLFRTTLSRPIPTAAFLIANGAVLYGGERLRRRVEAPTSSGVPATVPAAGNGEGPGSALDAGAAADIRLARLSLGRATLIGSAQVLALLPGISRSGVTMVAGLLRGLSHEDAARFSFLLATPVILAAGALKIPDLTGPLGAGIHGPILVGSIASFVSAYLAVRFLTRYFETRTLTPFAVYCMLFGTASLIWLLVR